MTEKMNNIIKFVILFCILTILVSFLFLSNKNIIKDTNINNLGSSLIILSLLGLILCFIFFVLSWTKKLFSKNRLEPESVPKVVVPQKRRHKTAVFLAIIAILAAAFFAVKPKLTQDGMDSKVKIQDISGDSKINVIVRGENQEGLGGVGICVSPRLGAQDTLDSKCGVTEYETGMVSFNVKEGKYWIFLDLKSMELYDLDPKIDKNSFFHIEVKPKSINDIEFMVFPKKRP